MGVTIPKKRSKSRVSHKQRRREAVGIQFCVPYDTDAQLAAIMKIHTKLKQSPMNTAISVRYNARSAYVRLKHGVPPTAYKCRQRSSLSHTKTNPKKTATLNKLLVFTVPDSGTDTEAYLKWSYAMDPILNKVYRGGHTAIRLYDYTRTGIGAYFTNSLKILPMQLPQANDELRRHQEMQVNEGLLCTRVATETDEWRKLMKGKTAKQKAAILASCPELPRYHVQDSVYESTLAHDAWFVGCEETQWPTEEAARKRLAEIRATAKLPACVAPTPSVDPVAKAARQAVVAKTELARAKAAWIKSRGKRVRGAKANVATLLTKKELAKTSLAKINKTYVTLLAKKGPRAKTLADTKAIHVKTKEVELQNARQDVKRAQQHHVYQKERLRKVVEAPEGSFNEQHETDADNKWADESAVAPAAVVAQAPAQAAQPAPAQAAQPAPAAVVAPAPAAVVPAFDDDKEDDDDDDDDDDYVPPAGADDVPEADDEDEEVPQAVDEDEEDEEVPKAVDEDEEDEEVPQAVDEDEEDDEDDEDDEEGDKEDDKA